MKSSEEFKFIDSLRTGRIKSRLMASFFALAGIPLLVLTILFSIVSYTRLERQTVLNLKDSLQLVKGNLDVTLRVFLSKALEISTNYNLATAVSAYPSVDDFNKGILKQQMYQLIINRFSPMHELIFIEVYDESGRLLSIPFSVTGTSFANLIHETGNLGPNKYSAIFIMDSPQHSGGPDTDFYTQLANPVVIVAKILLPTLNKTVGYLTLSFDNRVLETFSADKETRYIVDSTDKILFAFPNKNSSPLQHRGEKFDRDLYRNDFVSQIVLDTTDWTIVSILHRDRLLDDLQVLVALSLSSLVVGIGLVAFLSNVVTRSITVPLDNISDSMNRFKGGELSARISDSGRDEIASLANDFNLMAKQHQMLIREVYQAKLSQQEEEFRLLQAQINPHFLYNTLDFINWKAYTTDNRDICTVVQALSNFYRLSLNRGEEVYTIREEVDLIKNYLDINELRFPGLINFSIEVEPRCLDLYTLKLILQPLVENAIVHGLAPLEKGGPLHISIEQAENAVRFEVEDGGVGGDVDSFFNKNTRSDGKHGFGVANIDRRIKLYYGPAYGLTFHGNRIGGVTARVAIPILAEPGTGHPLQEQA